MPDFPFNRSTSHEVELDFVYRGLPYGEVHLNNI